MSILPRRIDRMPEHGEEAPIHVAHLIAFALNSVPYEWWRAHKSEPPLSETSAPVRAVMDVLRIEGFEIVRKSNLNHRTTADGSPLNGHPVKEAR